MVPCGELPHVLPLSEMCALSVVNIESVLAIISHYINSEVQCDLDNMARYMDTKYYNVTICACSATS